MPRLLKTELDDMKARHFWQTVSQEGAPITYEAFDNFRIPVKSEDLPIHLQATDGPNGTYDLMQGIGASWLVSSRLKDLFQSWDRLAGTFFPVVLHMPDGKIEQTHFWHRMTEPVDDGIELSVSDAKPVKVAGQTALYSTPHNPKIVWKDETIAGRHVWTDRFLRNRLFISDDLLGAMTDSGMSGFKAVESPPLSEI